jgi:short chain dehydrogenase
MVVWNGSDAVDRCGRAGHRVVGRNRPRRRCPIRGARILVHGRAVLGDLAVAADRHRIAAEAVDAFGRVDVLVNNAGFGYLGPVSVMDFDVIRRLVEVNLLASIELTRSLLPRMMEQTAAPSASSRRSQGAQVWPVKRSTRRPRQVSTPSPTVCGARPPDPAPTSASSFPAWSTLGSSRLAAVPMCARFRVRSLQARSPMRWSEPCSATAQKSGDRAGFGSPRPCALWRPAHSAGLRSASVAAVRDFPSPVKRLPRNGTRCGSSRCPATAASGPPDDNGGSTPARTGASRP